MRFKYGLKAQKFLAQGSAQNSRDLQKLLPFQAVLEPQAKLESCYSKISDYSSCFFTQTL